MLSPVQRPLAPSSGSLRLALVLTPLGRNNSSLPNFYWTPLFDALTGVGIGLAVYQPRRVTISPVRLPGGRSSPKVSLVAPLFVRSLMRFRPTAILSTEYGPHTLFAILAARLLRVTVSFLRSIGTVRGCPALGFCIADSLQSSRPARSSIQTQPEKTLKRCSAWTQPAFIR